jgi:hypothetical protein
MLGAGWQSLVLHTHQRGYQASSNNGFLLLLLLLLAVAVLLSGALALLLWLQSLSACTSQLGLLQPLNPAWPLRSRQQAADQMQRRSRHDLQACCRAPMQAVCLRTHDQQVLLLLVPWLSSQ